MKAILAGLLALHGFIHLLGFAKAFHLAEVSQLTQPVSKPLGVMWLLATLLFLSTLILLVLSKATWWIPAVAALTLSQLLICTNWHDAKFGTLANLLLLIPAVPALTESLPSSFHNRYQAEVKKRLEETEENFLLSESDIAHLPAPVQRYLNFANVVGKPKVRNMRVVFDGEMKQDRNGKWLPIHAQQYNFFSEPARIFYIKSKLLGIPFDGLHLFANDAATMEIKLAHLLQVADARGEKMNQSETVTLLNDMCLFAPATLIDKNIRWETVDANHVKAHFTQGKITISATLVFDEQGALKNFISDDRYFSADGKKYERHRWSTPLTAYKEDVDGRKICNQASAIWHTPEGEFHYATFTTKAVEYNCTALKFIR